MQLDGSATCHKPQIRLACHLTADLRVFTLLHTRGSIEDTALRAAQGRAEITLLRFCLNQIIGHDIGPRREGRPELFALQIVREQQDPSTLGQPDLRWVSVYQMQ